MSGVVLWRMHRDRSMYIHICTRYRIISAMYMYSYNFIHNENYNMLFTRLTGIATHTLPNRGSLGRKWWQMSQTPAERGIPLQVDPKPP